MKVCAASLRAAIVPPSGEPPKLFRIQLELAFGEVAAIRVSESSGVPDVDKAGLEAVRAAVPASKCRGLDRLTVIVPFR